MRASFPRIEAPWRGEFECGFTPEAWDNIAGLIEPFIRGSSGFQWLATIHWTRRQIAEKFDGDLAAILEAARKR